MTGKGKLTYPNKDFYEGDFVDGKQHGEGTLQYISTKTSYKGPWNNGKQHGLGLITKKDGQSRKAFYSEGKFINWVANLEQNCKTYQEIDDLSSIL